MLNIEEWRWLGLAALTGVTLGGTLRAFKALGGTEKLPPLDALADGPPGGDKWPSVSVIVPARNEERNLPRLLPTLLSQRYRNYEVIVVDDQSFDSTLRILADWARRAA